MTPSPGNGNSSYNNPTYDLGKLTTLAQNQAAPLQLLRQALNPTPTNTYVDSVLGHRVEKGHCLSVRPNQHLQPILLARRICLFKEQWNDSSALEKLVQFGAADLANASEAIIMLGSKAERFLKRLNIDLDRPSELEEQEGLFADEQEVTKPILDSTLEAIQTMFNNGQGQSQSFIVAVSPDLYREAYTNKHSPMDAPIYQIQPLLADKGFLFSEALGTKRGVIFSLARGSISLNIPLDISVERLTDDDRGQPRFRVVEQMRLVIDDPDARATLK
jgi:hypothetical protein